MGEILRERVEHLFDQVKSLRADTARTDRNAAEIEREVGQILAITDELQDEHPER